MMNIAEEIVQSLRKSHFNQTELCFYREYLQRLSSNHFLPSLRNSANVYDYFAVYSYLANFIDQSSYQIELIQFLFPLFVHLYLDLIEHDYIKESQYFYQQFASCTLRSLHTEFFYQLKLISQTSKHLSQCPLTHAFRTSRFFLRLSMTSCTELQNFIDHTKHLIKSNITCGLTSTQLALLLSIFHQYLKIDINQQLFRPSNVVYFQTIEQPMTPIFVHTTLANKIQFTRLYTGIFPVQSGSIDGNRRDLTLIYPQVNYNTDANHIPRLGPHQLPSICLLTLKTKQIVNCLVLSNDCELLALGFQSSEILICTLNPNNRLHSMKAVKDLRYLLSNPHLPENILDKTTSNKAVNERVLIGHTAAIFTLAFEPTKQTYLLSGSQDCTVRLWHLATWSCLVTYKLHFQPILNGNILIMPSRTLVAFSFQLSLLPLVRSLLRVVWMVLFVFGPSIKSIQFESSQKMDIVVQFIFWNFIPIRIISLQHTVITPYISGISIMKILSFGFLMVIVIKLAHFDFPRMDISSSQDVGMVK